MSAPNVPGAGPDERDRVIRELTAEVARLRAELAAAGDKHAVIGLRAELSDVRERLAKVAGPGAAGPASAPADELTEWRRSVGLDE